MKDGWDYIVCLPYCYFHLLHHQFCYFSNLRWEFKFCSFMLLVPLQSSLLSFQAISSSLCFVPVSWKPRLHASFRVFQEVSLCFIFHHLLCNLSIMFHVRFFLLSNLKISRDTSRLGIYQKVWFGEFLSPHLPTTLVLVKPLLRYIARRQKDVYT